jgi:hypothetical protein
MKKSRIVVPNNVIFVKDPMTKKFPVIKDQNIDFNDYKNIILDLEQNIINGVPLDEEFYRKSNGKDYLLENKNRLHLHLADDVLLIVEQWDDRVIFIVLTNHSLFEEIPKGKTIDKWLGKAIAEARISKILGTIIPPTPMIPVTLMKSSTFTLPASLAAAALAVKGTVLEQMKNWCKIIDENSKKK